MQIHQVKTSERYDKIREQLVRQFRLIQAELRGTDPNTVATLAVATVTLGQQDEGDDDLP